MYYVGGIACNSNYLEHFGIPGMKWGVRKYQNPDGTLTPAGIQRYNKVFEKNYNNMNNYIRAYNRMADDWNHNKIKSFNEEWTKKHGEDYGDDYVEEYYKRAGADVEKYRSEEATRAALKSVGLTSVDQITKGRNAETAKVGQNAVDSLLGTKRKR